MASLSPDPDPPAARAGPLGKLYLLPISAWSRRVLLTLKHARANVKVREYSPVLTENKLWIRLGFTRRKITAPALLRPRQECLMDSHAIARILDAARAREVPTLFPAAGDETLRRLVAHAETVASFGRAGVVSYLQTDTEMARRLLVPPFLQRMPFSLALARSSVEQFATKYADESSAASEARVREALADISAAVKAARDVDGVRYLVGDALTYADFAVTLSLPFVKDENSHFKDIPPSPLGDEFPEVREYAEAILKKYVTAADVAFPPPRYDDDGKIV